MVDVCATTGYCPWMRHERGPDRHQGNTLTRTVSTSRVRATARCGSSRGSYTRGGGSSGSRVSDGGATERPTSTLTADRGDAAYVIGCAAIVAGAQGVIVRQPVGPQGSWHPEGFRPCCSGAREDCAMRLDPFAVGMFAIIVLPPGMSAMPMSAIPTSVEDCAEIESQVQPKPLSTKIRYERHTRRLVAMPRRREPNSRRMCGI